MPTAKDNPSKVLHSTTVKASGAFHSATEKASGTLHATTENDSGTLHAATEKASGTLHSATEKGSGALHSATEKTQSAKQAFMQSTCVQRYIVGPAVYTKECFVIGSRMVSRYVKSEMSLARLLLSVATVLVVLGCMTFSGLSITVSKEKVVVSTFKVHPPSPRSALWTSAWVGMVSILATIFVPPAFRYARVHALCSRTENEKKRKGSVSDSVPVSDERPISSTTATGPFETYRKQADKTGTGGGGCRHPRHGANATADAVSEALAGAKEE